MSLLLRSVPLISLRSRPLSVATLSFCFFFQKLKTKPFSSARLCSTSASAASSPAADSLLSDPKHAQPLKESLVWVSRTKYCGDLSTDDVGKKVRLCGWVALHRIHGGLTFVNLRDQTGLVQITTLPDEFPDAHSIVNELRLEYVIVVEGTVRARPAESVNEKMKTGVIEIAAEHVQVLNAVKSKLPFLVTTSDDAKDTLKEEIRLRYRCLDLRRQQMNSNIMLRHTVVKFMRRYLEDRHGFVEVD